jgi:hypothetical protein
MLKKTSKNFKYQVSHVPTKSFETIVYHFQAILIWWHSPFKYNATHSVQINPAYYLLYTGAS